MEHAKLYRLLSVVAMLVTAGNAPAAILQGTVTDTLTRAPVESVLVTVKGTAAQTYTDAQGIFTLNTTDDIREHRLSGPVLPWSALRAADSRIYTVDGTHRATGRADCLTGLPDGMYVVATVIDGRGYTGTMLKTGGWSCPAVYGTAAKAAGTVTLVYTHPYYNPKEAMVDDNDTSVTERIKLLPPGLATTGPRSGGLADMTPQQVLEAHGTVISGRRITGGLTFQATWNYSYDPRGKTYTLVDCEIQGGVAINTGLNSSSGQGHITPDADMLTLNLTHCRLDGALYTTAGFKGTIERCSFQNKSQWAVNDTYNPGADAPGHTFHVLRDCYFWAPYQVQPSHYEVVQSFTKVAGLTVINCTFEQQGGPLANSGITAIMNIALAPDNVFDHCYFLWDGAVPTYYTIYAAGNGTFKNCFIEEGTALLYPGSQCTFTNCRSYNTGNLLVLP